MAKTKTEPELMRVGSHYVTLGASSGRDGKEEVYLYFNTEWRGQPATVTMQASRYIARIWATDGSDESRNDWTEWRIYASEAKFGRFYMEDGNVRQDRGGDLTQTARHRVSEGLEARVLEWLASPAYTASSQRAHFHALDRIVTDLRGYGTPPSRDIRDAITRHADKLTDAAAAHFVRVADAYDAFMAVRWEKVD